MITYVKSYDWGIIGSLSIVLGTVVVLTDIGSRLPFLLLIAALTLLLIPIAVDKIILKRKIDFFEPHYIFIITVLLHFLLPAITFLSPNRSYSPQILGLALFAVILCCISFFSGYYSRRYSQHVRKFKIRDERVYRSVRFSPSNKTTEYSLTPIDLSDNRRSKKASSSINDSIHIRYSTKIILAASMLLMVIGFLGALNILSAVGGVQALFSLMTHRLDLFKFISGVDITLMRLFRLPFYLVLVIAFFKAQWRLSLLPPLAIAFVGIMSVGLFTGNRGDFLAPILIFMTFSNYQRKRIAPHQLMLFSILAVIFLLSYLVFVRSPYLSSRLIGFGIQGFLQFLWEESFGKNTFVEIRPMMDVIQWMPDKLDFQYGRTYLALFTHYIPRTILPSKLQGGAEIFALAFYPERWLRGAGGLRVSTFGELYMNFSWAGLVLGSFGLGWLMSFFYQSFAKRVSDARYTIIYSIIIVSFYFILRGNFVLIVSQIIIDVSLVYVILQIARIPKTRPRKQVSGMQPKNLSVSIAGNHGQ